MSQYISYSSRNSGGLSSLNGETGAVNLVAGSGISITPAGQNITIAATGGGGTVTSVALADSTSLFNITGSPVTTSGTLTLSSFQSKAQHSFFAAPSGSAGSPTFRSIVQSDISGDPNSVAYFNGSSVLEDDPKVGYFPTITQTFPPFSVKGFYVNSDLVNLSNSGFVFGSKDTSTDSFTTNLGMITGANLSISAVNDTGGVLFGTGEVSDPGATANTGAVNIFTGPNNASGTSGSINVTSGQTTDGASGNILISSGTSINSSTGSVNINTGSSSGGSSGDLKISAGPSDGIAFNGEAAFGTAPVSAVGASADSGVVQIESGPVLDSTSTGASGSLTIKSGDNLGLGNSGSTGLSTGTVMSGTSGNISIASGSSSSGISGGIFFQSGGSTSGNSGSISFQSGPSTSGSGSSGNYQVNTGNVDAGTSGLITLFSGTSTSGNSGVINIISGNAGSNTGALNIKSGNSTTTGNTGIITFESGDATAGNSGNLVLQTGTASATRGQIQFVDGTEGVSGYVWTSTDTSGSGSWMASGSGGANTSLSNLSATSINSDLIPNADVTINLGSPTESYLNGHIANLFDTSNVESIQVDGRSLLNTSASPIFRWGSGLSVSYDYTTPTNGFSYTIPDGIVRAILDPAGTLTTGTITMPANPDDGQIVGFSSTKVITSLTVSGNTGQTIADSVTTLAIGGSATFLFIAGSSIWYRIAN